MTGVADLFSALQFWHWWILAVVLMALEALAPGAIFLWLGIAAVPVGLMLLIWPGVSWETQLLTFAVLSIVSVVGWRIYLRAHPERRNPAQMLNRRGEQYVGRRFTLAEPIVNGQGRLHIDDTFWRIEGPDLAAGTTVKVMGARGTVLQVRPA